MTEKLNPDNALIFRIVHVKNVRWILENDGLYCRNSAKRDPNYVNIGDPELIEKRAARRIPVAPGGTFSDYVAFYFTPFSIMAYKIKTGHGVPQRDNKDIVYFVSSIHRLNELGLTYLFTDQHAYAEDAEFYNDPRHLDEIDWAILQTKDFKTNDADPGRQSRYQAEALVHGHVPLSALRAIYCYNHDVKDALERLTQQTGANLPVKKISACYF